jgi:hypothetical protein
VTVFRGWWTEEDLANEIDDCVAAGAEAPHDLKLFWLL